MPDIRASWINLFIHLFLYVLFFDNDSIRTKLNFEQKMHSSQMVHFGAPLQLVSKPLFCASILENSVLYNIEKGKKKKQPIRPKLLTM